MSIELDSVCSNINIDGILNQDQGYFRNITTSKINKYPSLNLALISNSCGDRNPDVEISLNTTYLSWNDFISLFFKSPAGNFYISSANQNNSAISFSSQTYETTFNQKVKFDLGDQIRKAYSKKNNKPENLIKPKVNIELNRQTFLIKSLGSVYGDFSGLSYDEALSTLLNSGEIEVGDCETSAIVNFSVSFQYYFEPLDICLLVLFNYKTSIPCFKNVTYFDDCVCPYSNDNKIIDRSGFDLSDNVSLFSDYESKSSSDYQTKASDCENSVSHSVSSNTEEYSIVSGKSNIISEISKIINGAESVASSDW